MKTIQMRFWGKRTVSFLGVVMLLLATALFWTAAEARAEKADDYIKAQMLQQHIPGLALAVVRNGKVIKAEGYGLSNVELNVPATPETVYKIGSVSKQFIATGIMLLVGEGKIGLDDKISVYLEGTPEAWKKITIRHLLTHTSGLVREGPAFDPFKPQGDAEVIKSAYPLQLLFMPGEKWEYSNLGYFTLAEIISRVSGKSWKDYLDERVFKPLKMSATRPTSIPDIIYGRANGYYLKDGQLKNTTDFIALRPSGAFVSNVLDLAKWDAALYTDEILKLSVLEQMWTPVKLNNGGAYPYGFGWASTNVNGHRVISHGGGITGFRSEFMRFVDDGLTIIVLTNCGKATPYELALGVAGFYIPDVVSPKAR